MEDNRIDLLERALERLRSELEVLVECNCLMRSDDIGDAVPVPGTIEPADLSDIRSLIALVRDIEADIGPFADHPNPDWLDDLIAGRWNPEAQADG